MGVREAKPSAKQKYILSLICVNSAKEELVATFHKLFDDKIKKTKAQAKKLAKHYGLLPGMIQ